VSRGGARRVIRVPAKGGDWRRVVAVYVAVQFAEIFGVSMIYAYLPLALESAGVPIANVASLAGFATAGLFVVGAPQVPIWLAIAELRSRRLVVVRSGLIALAALLVFSAAREAWQLVAATIALGFWLGNTGVMLATIREVTPRAQRGNAIALFSAAAPMGFAAGPLLAAWMIGGLGLPLSAPILVAAALNALLIVANLTVIPDVRPTLLQHGGVIEIAWRSLTGVARDPMIRAGYFVLFLAIAGDRMLRPILPLRIAEVFIGAGVGALREPLASSGVSSAVGLLIGLSALVGAICAPLIARLAARLGVPRMAGIGFLAAAVAALSLAVAPTLPLLALANGLLAAAGALLQAMVFGWLAESINAQRRSAALSLSLLPLYAGGIVGPGVTAVSVHIGASQPGDELALTPVFVVAAGIFGAGLIAVRRLRA